MGTSQEGRKAHGMQPGKRLVDSSAQYVERTTPIGRLR
jgi:hypothetical protein